MQHSHTQHFQLQTPRCVAVMVAAGDKVQVSEGCIWLTLEGQLRDVWLQAGDCWTVPVGGRSWISAEAPTTFAVGQAVAHAAFPQAARDRRQPLVLATACLA